MPHQARVGQGSGRAASARAPHLEASALQHRGASPSRSIFRRGAFLALAFALAGCSGGSAHSVKPSPLPSRLQHLFDYDRHASLDIRRQGRVHTDKLTVDALTYAAAGGRVPAYLLVPDDVVGKRPAVIFVHGYGGSRSDFVSEGAGVAFLGADVLTITMPYRPHAIGSPRALMIKTVIAIRRAIDLVSARKEVDRGRIALVGYSLGAQASAITAGLEDRLRAAILQAPPAHLDGANSDFDTIRYVRHAAPAWLYFQGGELDVGVPPRDVQALIDASPHPVEFKWYPTSHSFAPVTFRDQVAWLRDRLGLKGSPSK